MTGIVTAATASYASTKHFPSIGYYINIFFCLLGKKERKKEKISTQHIIVRTKLVICYPRTVRVFSIHFFLSFLFK